MVRSKKYFFSNYKMMCSAFPSNRSIDLLKFAIEIDEIEYVEANAGNGQGIDKYWTPDGTYCAALCAEVLGLPDPDKCTASDVVELCRRNLGARDVAQPILYSEIRTKDDADIVRTARVVVHSNCDDAYNLV